MDGRSWLRTYIAMAKIKMHRRLWLRAYLALLDTSLPVLDAVYWWVVPSLAALEEMLGAEVRRLQYVKQGSGLHPTWVWYSHPDGDYVTINQIGGWLVVDMYLKISSGNLSACAGFGGRYDIIIGDDTYHVEEPKEWLKQIIGILQKE